MALNSGKDEKYNWKSELWSLIDFILHLSKVISLFLGLIPKNMP